MPATRFQNKVEFHQYPGYGDVELTNPAFDIGESGAETKSREEHNENPQTKIQFEPLPKVTPAINPGITPQVTSEVKVDVAPVTPTNPTATEWVTDFGKKDDGNQVEEADQSF